MKAATRRGLASLATVLWTAVAGAQTPAFELTPTVDLGLQAVALEVPPSLADALPEGLSMRLPPGFGVRVFATKGLSGPRFMAWSPDGVLHVANMRLPEGKGQIVALPDADDDGVADTARVVVDGLRQVHSMAFHDGALFVADTDALLRFADGDGDGAYESRTLLATLPAGGLHVTRTVVVDAAAAKLYVSVGSTCDLCREDDPERAAVLQFDLDGGGRRVFASGLRNAVGLALQPRTGQLWSTNNGHDREGASLPPERVDIVREGGFYGWPLAYADGVWVDFSVRAYAASMLPLSAADSLAVAGMEAPVALAPAHLAPMAIHFYTGTAFPERYRQAAFVAFRAGHNAAVPGWKVSALFSRPDGQEAHWADFLTGFGPDPEAGRGVWGTPVGLTSDPQGRLYVTTDFVHHTVLRVEYVGGVTAVQQEGPRPAGALGQNLPNPFNGETVIPFVLERPGTVELALYNPGGQLVVRLVRGQYAAGPHRVRWDGRDAAGRPVGSGVYFYRLRRGQQVETRRLVLLR